MQDLRSRRERSFGQEQARSKRAKRELGEEQEAVVQRGAHDGGQGACLGFAFEDGPRTTRERGRWTPQRLQATPAQADSSRVAQA